MGKALFNAIGRGVRWMFGETRVERLLLAATVVAGVRMMLIAAVFMNFNLAVWPWFKAAEVICGLAYAVLEGKALGYTVQMWVQLKPADKREWFFWGLLALGQLVLFASIIGVTAYAASAVRREMTIDALLGNNGAVAWSVFVTALNPLMVILIGVAKAIDSGGGTGELITTRSREKTSLGAFSVDELAAMLSRKQPTLTPDAFVAAMRDSLGVEMTVEDASRYLLAAQPAEAPRPAPAGRKNGKTPD